ncbi:MAG: hypothetical protein MUE85_04620 [Microscillaceae bacterium]|jgi:hypothetical protein|nr:hypothetical protein [Microscillaceae bacterium]
MLSTAIQSIQTGEELFSSRFSKHVYVAESQTLFTYWTEDTEKMNKVQFEQEMHAWLKASETCSPHKIYDYCKGFLYPIDPDEQIWLAHLLNEGWVRLGVQKYAHIVPEELITNIGTMQLFEEFENMKLPNQFVIQHFSDEDEALHWLESGE